MKNLLLLLALASTCVACNEETTTPRGRKAPNFAMIYSTLDRNAPDLVGMEKGIDQVLALVDRLNNSTSIKRDERIIHIAPSESLDRVFNDPTYGLICGGFALTVFDTLTALGYENRMVQMFGANGTDGHIANEVLIDGQWIAIDATFNIVFRGVDGELLSYKEMHRQFKELNHFEPEYLGSTILALDDYYIPYSEIIHIIRRLPQEYRHMPSLDYYIEGQEVFEL